MYSLPLAILLLTPPAMPQSPPVDPLESLIGRWEGTHTVTQKGQCSMNGKRELTMPEAIVVRREADGKVRAGISPVEYTGSVGLTWRVDLQKGRVRILWPKTITCGTETIEVLERLNAELLPPDGDVRKLRLTGFSATCPKDGCIFDERFDLVWKSPPPPAPPAKR